MHVFYSPDIELSNTLSEEESQHAIKVLRLRVDDEIIVLDGVGGMFKSRIVTPDNKRCVINIVQKIPSSAAPCKLHLAVAPTKNIERFEWFIEKVTEIGVFEITPLICRNSERKILKPERLRKIIVSASKQSIKEQFPKLNPLFSFDDFMVKTKELNVQKMIAHCHETHKRLLKNTLEPNTDVIILIGPEGDFSTDEIDTAIKSDFLPVSLGNSRLRTETAAVVACHTVALINQ